MDGLLNFYQATDTIATAGQPTQDQLVGIARRGTRVVVNLAMTDFENALLDEGSIVASLGMAYIHLPVPFDAPTPYHLKKFFALMAAFDGEKVFVHCAVNARVSVFMHQYLTIKKGYASKDATSPLLKKWTPTMNDVWQEMLKVSV